MPKLEYAVSRLWRNNANLWWQSPDAGETRLKPVGVGLEKAEGCANRDVQGELMLLLARRQGAACVAPVVDGDDRTFELVVTPFSPDKLAIRIGDVQIVVQILQDPLPFYSTSPNGKAPQCSH